MLCILVSSDIIVRGAVWRAVQGAGWGAVLGSSPGLNGELPRSARQPARRARAELGRELRRVGDEQLGRAYWRGASRGAESRQIWAAFLLLPLGQESDPEITLIH